MNNKEIKKNLIADNELQSVSGGGCVNKGIDHNTMGDLRNVL